MTDPGPSFPPPEPLPSVTPPVPPIETPPALPPATSGTPQLPQPAPPRPLPAAFTAPPPRTKLSPLVILVIVISTLVIGGGLIVGAVSVTNFLAGIASSFESPDPIPQPAPQSGAPGSPIAATADDCPDDCFFYMDIDEVIPSASELRAAGLVTTYTTRDDFAPGTVMTEYDFAVDDWTASEGAPDECFFAYTQAPMALSLDTPPDHSNGSIEFIGEYGDSTGDSVLTQSARLFTTSQDAVNHMIALDSAMPGCSTYATTNWSASLTAAAAIDVPANVAAVGWIEQSPTGRYYVMDLQRSNLVVRTSLFSIGVITEADFRSFVSEQAIRLAAIDGASNSSPGEGECEVACITAEQLATVTPRAELLGLTVDAAYTVAAPAQTQDLWNASRASSGRQPDVCFFDLSTAPIDPAAPLFTNLEDPMIDQGRFTNGPTTLTQVTRLYNSELYASRHAGALRSPIIQCAEYSYLLDGTSHSVTLQPRATPDLPSGATVATWSTSENGMTRRVADIQYRNLVTRVTVVGDVSDESFDAYVLATIEQLTSLG